MHERHEKASKRSCLFLLLLIFVVLPFSVLALGLLLWFGRESSGNRQLKSRIATLKKKGYPVDDATVETFYKDRTDPTHTNAWLEILTTINGSDFGTSTKGVPILGVSNELPTDLDAVWPEEQVARDFLERWKPLSSETLRLSIDATSVRFPIVFDSFNSIDMKRIQGLRQIARLLNLQGYVAMRDGNSAGVRDAVAGLLGLSRVNAGEPMVVSHLVSLAIDGMAIGVLKDAIQFDVLSETDLLFLLPRVLTLTDIGKDWDTAFAGERALALPLFTDRKRARSAEVMLPFSNSRDAIFYIELIDAMLEEQADDLAEFKAKLKAVENNLGSKVRASWLSQLDSIMTMQTAPAVTAGGDAFIRRALQHRIAATAIGLRLHERRHGRFPGALKELADLPLNLDQVSPSKKQSFGYRLEGKNAKVWGGSFRDAFDIPPVPRVIEPNSTEADSTGAVFWTWELRVE